MVIRPLLSGLGTVVPTFAKLAFSRIMSQGKSKQQWYYAVGIGRQRGVYLTWAECNRQVQGVTNAKFLKFINREQAEAFVESYSTPNSSPVKSPMSSPAKSYGGSQASQSSSQPVNVQKRLFHSQEEASQESKRSRTVAQSQPVASSSRDHQHQPVDPDNGTALQEEVRRLKQKSDKLEEEFNKFKEEKTREMKILRGEISQLQQQIVELRESLQTQPERTKKSKKDKEGTRQETNEPTPGPSSRDDSALESCVNRVKSRVKTERRAVEIEAVAPPPPEPTHEDFALHIDSDGYCIVYTDGCSLDNGKPHARAGVGVWFGNGHKLNMSEPLKGNCRPTNNNAEIQAATLALNLAKFSGITKLNIHTDSDFTIKCICNWMPKWQENGWKTANGAPVKNKEELLVLLTAMEGMDIRWTHVPGHSNIHGNEEADRLANLGALRYVPIHHQ